MSIKMGYTVYMGHGYVCGDPQLQLMCTVLVLFSNVPCKACVDVEVFAPVSVFECWRCWNSYQLPVSFSYEESLFEEMTNMGETVLQGYAVSELVKLKY